MSSYSGRRAPRRIAGGNGNDLVAFVSRFGKFAGIFVFDTDRENGTGAVGLGGGMDDDIAHLGESRDPVFFI